jgi:hypothetical protein
MAARPRGQVVERYGKSGRTYAIRFHAHGRRRYLTLGRESEGWTRRRAEDELANVLADVRRDLWIEPLPGARGRRRERKPETLFAVFADDLLAERRPQLSEATGGYLEWGLRHLRPFFADWLLRDIDAEAVDATRADELLEARSSIPLPKGLSPHKLRHTFASVLVACGEDPASVMYQLGHVDPTFTLRVYPTLCGGAIPSARICGGSCVDGSLAEEVGSSLSGPVRYRTPIICI